MFGYAWTWHQYLDTPEDVITRFIALANEQADKAKEAHGDRIGR